MNLFLVILIILQFFGYGIIIFPEINAYGIGKLEEKGSYIENNVLHEWSNYSWIIEIPAGE